MVWPPPMGKGRSSYACERNSSETNSCRGTAFIAASTPLSVMPRRRNCFSIISIHCAAYSFFSSMRDRRCMFFPRARFQDLLHLRERKVTFFIAIVEVWREANAGFGTVVDEDVPGEEFAANLVGIGTFDGNRPRTLLRFFWCVHTPAARLGACDEPCGHAHGFFANRRNANLVENLQSRLAGIERGNVGGTVQIAERIIPGIDGARFECKRSAVRAPPRDRGAQLRAQIFADIQVADTRSAAEPLEDSAHRKINPQAAHVERDRSRSLENIENHVRADAVSPLNNGTRIHDAGTAEKNLRNRNQERRFVDGRKQLIQINANVVRSRNNFDARAETLLLVVEVLNRRKLELDHHHLVTRPAKFKAGRNHRLD